MPAPLANFLPLLDPGQGSEVYQQWIPRARLGLHIRLSEIANRIDQALTRQNSSRVAMLMTGYFSMVGFDPAGLSGLDQIAAYTQIVNMNQLQWVAHFQTRSGNPDYKPPPWDYEGRQWIYWIHKLGSRYGWTRDEIFDLWPEEAAALIQEIFVSEVQEADDRRALSRFGYKEDKQAKVLRFQPLPRPGWMVPEVQTKPVKVLRSMLPYGIDTPDGEPTIVH